MVTVRPTEELLGALLVLAAPDFLAGFFDLAVAVFFAGDAAVFLSPEAVEDRVVRAMV